MTAPLSFAERTIRVHDLKRKRNLDAMSDGQKDKSVRHKIRHAIKTAKRGDQQSVDFLREVMLAEISDWPAEDIIFFAERLDALPPEEPPPEPGPLARLCLSLTGPWVWFVSLVPLSWLVARNEADWGDPLAEFCADCNHCPCVCDEVEF